MLSNSLPDTVVMTKLPIYFRPVKFFSMSYQKKLSIFKNKKETIRRSLRRYRLMSKSSLNPKITNTKSKSTRSQHTRRGSCSIYFLSL
ncbi:hypothetical protein L2E82_15139 [Cichorium intybus]|uniref:Uncharacterized protein n=1 Tax=Cichorium intybus TaxID=13427 RepID=A0ACB9F1B4_CICIN|nr:hypothetical protein L2E82_15139 [Cichorium intybus]